MTPDQQLDFVDSPPAMINHKKWVEGHVKGGVWYKHPNYHYLVVICPKCKRGWIPIQDPSDSGILDFECDNRFGCNFKGILKLRQYREKACE